jgi:hypothetical protein
VLFQKIENLNFATIAPYLNRQLVFRQVTLAVGNGRQSHHIWGGFKNLHSKSALISAP